MGLRKKVRELERVRQQHRAVYRALEEAAAHGYLKELGRGASAPRLLLFVTQVVLLVVRALRDGGLVVAIMTSVAAGISGLAGGLASAKWLVQLAGGALGCAMSMYWFTGGPPRSRRVNRPPGARLERLVEFVFSQKTQERVFLPILADLQLEYFDALASQRLWKARWVRVRGYVGFWRAVGLHGMVKLVLDVLRAVKGAA